MTVELIRTFESASMIAVGSIRTIGLARYRIDFRKGYWSLLAEANNLGLKPEAVDALLLISRDSRKIKLLYGDATDLWVSYKVFHKSAMKSLIEFTADRTKEALTSADLGMLLEGTLFSVYIRVRPFVGK